MVNCLTLAQHGAELEADDIQMLALSHFGSPKPRWRTSVTQAAVRRQNRAQLAVI